MNIFEIAGLECYFLYLCKVHTVTYYPDFNVNISDCQSSTLKY